MEEVENANTGKGAGDDVGEDGRSGGGVHRAQPREDVVELGARVDDDEDVGGFKGGGVPEEHPGADAKVSEGVVGDVVSDLVELFAFMWNIWGQLIEAVEPGYLDELLGEEEGADEVGLWGPETEVRVVDVQHVRGGEYAVLLGGEVEDKGCGREPFRCAVGDAHRGLVWWSGQFKDGS